MLIALGWDHRGKVVAKKLLTEVLFPTGPIVDDSSITDIQHQIIQKDAADISFIGSLFDNADTESGVRTVRSGISCWDGAIIIRGSMNENEKLFIGTKIIPLTDPEYLELPENNGESQSSGSIKQIDYPDIAAAVAKKVSLGEVDHGILIGGTGIGMSITANKFKGVRAAVCYNEVAAELSRRHNNANVLCLPGEMLGKLMVATIVKKWLATSFEGDRHQRRIEKINKIEEDTGL
ncbi:MAG: RpiB/LacA/LacB family sugar-phosphate isomerase [Planctomycetia bacterium]|nr:RpiB/LacA/LacB family sugar-phosphate isomerase [Planctomycetia bacterium]